MDRTTKFALAGGMRQGEIGRILIKDIDWKNKTVLIRKRKDPRHKKMNDQKIPLMGESLELARKQTEGRDKGRLFPYNSRSVSRSFQLSAADVHKHLDAGA